jgi:trehalose 6-phosphate phosphatase
MSDLTTPTPAPVPTPSDASAAEPAGQDDARAALTALTALVRDPARQPILLGLDFDGTLAPLQDDPMTSCILPEGVRALAALSAPDSPVRLALVSGRALGDLHKLAEVPRDTVLIGSHGAERARVTEYGLDRAVVRLSAEQSDLLAALGAQAAAIARGRDGVWVETKPTAVVVHTRLADDSVGASAHQEAVAMAERLGARVLYGKDVIEIPVIAANKGDALRELAAEVGARSIVYAGDDLTDEHAFAALGPDDVTVKVGPGPTAARYRVGTPQELTGLLTAMAEAVSRP